MEKAFEAGYDPALEVARHGEDDAEEHLRRDEQDYVDRIIAGEDKGHYFLFLGPKVNAVGCCVTERCWLTMLK